jgi:hypothetical protein
MKLLPSIVIAIPLAVLAPGALPDTIYKCTQADGATAFSNRPCEGKARETKQLAVPAPEPDDVSAARLELEREKLAAADKKFRQRQGARDAGYARSGAGVSMVNVPSKSSKLSQKEADRQEAARLNKARIGNCSMPRPEANCL